jgi:hypothetical protein
MSQLVHYPFRWAHRRAPRLRWQRVLPGGVKETTLLQHLDRVSDAERAAL